MPWAALSFHVNSFVEEIRTTAARWFLPWKEFGLNLNAGRARWASKLFGLSSTLAMIHLEHLSSSKMCLGLYTSTTAIAEDDGVHVRLCLAVLWIFAYCAAPPPRRRGTLSKHLFTLTRARGIPTGLVHWRSPWTFILPVSRVCGYPSFFLSNQTSQSTEKGAWTKYYISSRWRFRMSAARPAVNEPPGLSRLNISHQLSTCWHLPRPV
jgi:hypothetical protein